ncbi:MAG: hypothetical protein IJA12_02460 [Oscillospiraceae bacterium]|nr:hypothetical protein [Oscillospiraceae bacterium]
MKKIVFSFIFSVLMIVSLTACGNGDSVKCTPNLNRAFCVNAEIDYDGFISEAKFQRYGTASWEVEFSSPDTLAGVVLSFEDTNVEASYKGLSFSVPKSALPVKSIISEFISVADKIAAEPEINGEEDDDSIIVEGESELGEYDLIFDKNCTLTGFEMPNLNLIIKFTDFCDNNFEKVSEATTEIITTITEKAEDSKTTETILTEN